MRFATRKGTPKIRFAAVVGDINVPDDMLRRDIAFASDDDPGIIAFPTFKTRKGNLGGSITEGRWDSFGVRIDEITDPETLAHLRISLVANPQRWVTQRHPVSVVGRFERGGLIGEARRRDYGSFIPITLATFLDHKRKDTEGI